MIEALAIIGAVVLAFIFGKRKAKVDRKTDDRNQAIATQQRIDHATDNLPADDDQRRQWLRDRARR